MTDFTSHNREKAYVITILFSIIIIFTLILPLTAIFSIPLSGIGTFFIQYSYFSIFISLLLTYIIYNGIFVYYIKIDSYTISIISYRTISGLFKEKLITDMSLDMLVDYRFFNRPFSFNKTLMLKIRTESGKHIAKRFNISFLKKTEEEKIRLVLDKIKNCEK